MIQSHSRITDALLWVAYLSYATNPFRPHEFGNKERRAWLSSKRCRLDYQVSHVNSTHLGSSTKKIGVWNTSVYQDGMLCTSFMVPMPSLTWLYFLQISLLCYYKTLKPPASSCLNFKVVIINATSKFKQFWSTVHFRSKEVLIKLVIPHRPLALSILHTLFFELAPDSILLWRIVRVNENHFDWKLKKPIEQEAIDRNRVSVALRHFRNSRLEL